MNAETLIANSRFHRVQQSKLVVTDDRRYVTILDGRNILGESRYLVKVRGEETIGFDFFCQVPLWKKKKKNN